MSTPIFIIEPGDAPIIAAAVHDAHETRDEIGTRFRLNDDERLREEDPFTGQMARAVAEVAGGALILGRRSRFEVDLNRPRAGAIYLRPEDAWGLEVWREELDEQIVARSLAQFDDFYDEVRRVIEDATRKFGRVVVYDLHSYNHRREGSDGPTANTQENPEVNIGTGTLSDRQAWAPIIESVMNDLSQFDFLGRGLDVRENVKFRGGYFSRWLYENFPGQVCAIAIEWKKFWMDEWSGEADEEQLQLIRDALRSTVPGVLRELEKEDR